MKEETIFDIFIWACILLTFLGFFISLSFLPKIETNNINKFKQSCENLGGRYYEIKNVNCGVYDTFCEHQCEINNVSVGI